MWPGIWSAATIRIGFWTWIWSTSHCGLGQEVACWFQCWKNSFRSTDLITLVLLMWKWLSVLEEKSSFKKLGWHFLPNWIGALTLSLLLELPSKKIGALIRSTKFRSPEVALYLYESTIRPCMEYCCHFWAGVSSCYLKLLDELQKRVCRTVGSSLAASLEPLAHRRNVASLSLFYSYYFGRFSFELFSKEVYLLFW